MRATVVCSLLLGVFLARSPAPCGAQPPRDSGFFLSAHAFLDPNKRPAVLVSAEVPYANLVFLRKDGQFRSDYIAYIKILDKKRKIVDSAVVTGGVTSGDYEETRSPRLRSKTTKRFHLPQGDYIVECVIEVKETQRVFEQETTVVVPEFVDTGMGVGTPRLYAARTDGSARPPLVVGSDAVGFWGAEQADGTFFVALDRHPVVGFEVYAEEETSDTAECEVYFQVVDEKRETRAYGRSRARIPGSRTEVSVYLAVDGWDPGPYTFVAKVLQRGRARETTSSLAFELAYTRAMLARHFEKTLAALSLVAGPEEVSELRDAGEADRPRVWAAIWARRDPTPGTERNEALEEHLRRVRHATDNFADAGAGWESDRGKVYIRHGEPDHTELRVDPQIQGEYLIWYYYRYNLRFVFYDRFGLGEYRLTDTGQL